MKNKFFISFALPILSVSIILMAFTNSTFAQTTIPPPPDTTKTNSNNEAIMVFAEKMPQFPGGEMALRMYIAENIIYPEKAQEGAIEGKVYVRFVIEKSGEVGDVEVVRGVDKLLDNEAVRVIKSLPNFTPGEQRGKPVRVFYTLPIDFKLN